MNATPWLLTVLVLGGNPAPGQVPPSAKVEGGTPETLEWRNQYRGDSDVGAEVVMNAIHWNRLWRGLEQSAPDLDFSKYCAVAAHAGTCPTGGFTLEFFDPVSQGDDLLIRWRVRPPSPHSYTTQAITHPWKVKAFPRPKGKVKLEQIKD